MKGIVILDFGGQYAHLIASRIRRLGVYSEIREAETSTEDLKDAGGIILSGGPQSVYDKGSPKGDPALFELGVPVLGICYGLHWMTQTLGGEVRQGKVKEYGKTLIRTSDQRPATSDPSLVTSHSSLFGNCSSEFTVWMSHGDEAVGLPDGFEQIATSDSCKNAAFADLDRNLFAVQFHPEVTHTEHGNQILQNFVELCDADPWSVSGYKDIVSEEIKTQVGDRKVFMLVSGGVDSSVAFTLLDQVLGADRVQGLLVDTGMMRKDEVKLIQEAFKDLDLPNLRVEDASDRFFKNLKGVYDPEKKREIIGNTFIEVQKEVFDEMGLAGVGIRNPESGQSGESIVDCLPAVALAKAGRLRKATWLPRNFTLSNVDEWMLGQGTIYPDTIETGGTKHADKIKTHHNRVEAVQKMIEEGRVIEPLKDLYKDEVRELGEMLGLPHDLVWRHPFPGPGLGVRILCSESTINNQQSTINTQRSAILPVKSVGVQGDGRTYRYALAVFSENPFEVTDELWSQSTEIPNKDPEINRVLKCTSHPEPVEFVFTSGDVNRERADLLREADQIVFEEMHNADLYEKIWQFPVVLLPFGTSEGGQSVVLRPIDSTDAMTANASRLPEEVIKKMTERILALDGVDMVFYDLTSKPPGTIEWE